MKKLSRVVDYAIWAALAIVFAIVVLRRNSGPDTGHAAAAIDLPLLSQQGRFRLEDQRGKKVVIEVFASWCGACRRAAPDLADTYRDHASEVAFVGVMVDGNPEEARRAVREWQIPYDVALDDGTVAKSYKVDLLPTVVLVDERGVVKHVSAGVPSRGQLESWLREL